MKPKCGPPPLFLAHLEALENERNPDIGTLKKETGDIFYEFYTKTFKAMFLGYVNGVLFEMVKTALKDTYFGVTAPK